MSRRVWMILGLLGLAILGGGCRRSFTLVPVEGIVTQGGKPLAGVQVTFYPNPELGTEGPESLGLTDAAGHYQLQTSQGTKGAVVGHYRVCIVQPFLLEDSLLSFRDTKKASSEVLTPLQREKKSTELKVPAKYRNISKTPLRAEVRPGGPQTFDFNLP